LERSYSLLDVLDKEGQLIKADSTAEGMVYSISMDEPFLQIRLKNNLLIDRNTSFKYRINNERWIQSGSSEFIYAPRTKGMHTIEIQKEVDHLSSAPLMLHFRVYKKWFKTIWFKTLLGLLGFFVAFYIYKLNTREKRLLQNIKSLETESLRSYMNPHFISNSLNSINFYILDNKKSEASTYLVKFAKLIRSILQHTQNEFVLISQEIDTLSIYLDMEKMRFKDTFTFSIEKDNDISDDYQIPAMIIQPILENAILHGIRPSKRHGLVEVLFKKRPGGILVIIRDNGIGISNSMASKSSQNATRNSYGSQLIKRRIELLNELYRKDYEIHISDRDADFGTIVQLKL
jgi:LytS/YehU family sensor histidine kinase